MMYLQPKLGTRNLYRIVWHSQRDRDSWESRIERISSAWSTAEIESVKVGIRDLAMQPLTHLTYLKLLPWVLQNGLKAKVVRESGMFQGFANSYPSGNDLFITAIAREEAYLEEPEQHLGYPACCQKFFSENFPLVCDPMWQWAGEKTHVVAHPYSNPLLRYAGIRLIPHIPCSPTCSGSIELGTKMADLMPEEDRRSAEELLQQSISWDCYRSVAIVMTPSFRLLVGSVPTAQRYVVSVN